ncbi:hypothetical protein SAMN05216353_103189 [Halobacillus alkaliphilus]|uniref:DUF309 domain-containing protein n=1 Tax=Halobacillus alkaliphilus TaxID=396056 RepID=A0A1I2K8R4_9BACI|nr:DUF309 domain-containing protein [Halobacillus alkaliphilus]SFF62590.1 hypothetical protein SAMN05216353_103189 [Halobacillus alkaliphilus]
MYPEKYIEFLAHFHGTRDYFECHEVLEEHWKLVEPKNRLSVWVLLIQIAVCLYHYRRGNLRGALTLINRCLEKLEPNIYEIENIGISFSLLSNKLEEMKTQIEKGYSYKSMNLPIKDEQLLEEVQLLCTKWNVAYGSPSNLQNNYIIHKHKLRKK